MAHSLTNRLARAPVIPLIQADTPEVAVASAQALLDGGLGVIEVVLRTDEAITCLRHVVKHVPTAIVGAGTVLSAAVTRRGQLPRHVMPVTVSVAVTVAVVAASLVAHASADVSAIAHTRARMD